MTRRQLCGAALALVLLFIATAPRPLRAQDVTPAGNVPQSVQFADREDAPLPAGCVVRVVASPAELATGETAPRWLAPPALATALAAQQRAAAWPWAALPHCVAGEACQPTYDAFAQTYPGVWRVLGRAELAGCGVPTDGGRFVADVTLPDGTTVSPGQTLVKTWRLRNAGDTAWGAGYQLVFRRGDALGGPPGVEVPPTAPGADADISVPLAVPADAAPGRYRGYWQLWNSVTARFFGPEVYVELTVPGAAPPPVALAAAPPAAPPASGGPRAPRLALASYFAWYDDWNACNISAGDRPQNPYHSDDPQAIAQHVRLALDMGLDGFSQHWFAPGERTDRNFATLLAQSQGTGFQSTIIFARHIWHGSPAPTQANLIEALRYVTDGYGSHPNFLRVDGRPVLIFTDVYRVPRAAGQTPQQAWAAIRQQADPGHNALWIAEGLDASYLAVFDGLYVFKITHADFPTDYVKATRWANQVRQWEQTTGQPKIWMATISPGWDDLRAGCRPDVRAPSKLHRVDRQDGAFYQATFDAALASNPDWLWVASFNEWVEGSYIEPSVAYGDRYVHLTRDYIRQFKER